VASCLNAASCLSKLDRDLYDAEAYLTQVLSIDPNQFIAYLRRGDIRMRLSQFEGGLYDLRKASFVSAASSMASNEADKALDKALWDAQQLGWRGVQPVEIDSRSNVIMLTLPSSSFTNGSLDQITKQGIGSSLIDLRCSFIS
jgi:hypothetical protein